MASLLFWFAGRRVLMAMDMSTGKIETGKVVGGVDREPRKVTKAVGVKAKMIAGAKRKRISPRQRAKMVAGIRRYWVNKRKASK